MKNSGRPVNVIMLVAIVAILAFFLIYAFMKARNNTAPTSQPSPMHDSK